MNIILMRHYKVDMTYKKHYTSQGFDEASIDYNHSPIINQAPPHLPDYTLYASTMSRAQETARLAFGKEPIVLEGVEEVTMKSYKTTKKVVPRIWWETMARLQWRCNHHRPYEPYKTTMHRLEKALLKVMDSGDDAIIVMHGLAMRYMVKVLRKHGFKGPTILHAKNGQTFTYRRQE